MLVFIGVARNVTNQFGHAYKQLSSTPLKLFFEYAPQEKFAGATGRRSHLQVFYNPSLSSTNC